MSTAYPPRLIKYFFKSLPTRTAALTTPPRPDFYGTFPPIFGLYYAGPGKDFLSQNFYLAEEPFADADGGKFSPTEDEVLLYTVIFHKGPGTRQCTLYSGAGGGGGGGGEGVAPLAICTSARRWGDGVCVRVPGIGEGGWKIERMRGKGFSAPGDYGFEVEGCEFEWREDLSKRPHTRRLVRLGERGEGRSAASSSLSSRRKGKASEVEGELDVVAVWTEGSVPNRSGQIGWFKLLDERLVGNAYLMLVIVSTVLAACQRGPAVEGTMSWHEEKMLERPRE